MDMSRHFQVVVDFDFAVVVVQFQVFCLFIFSMIIQSSQCNLSFIFGNIFFCFYFVLKTSPPKCVAKNNTVCICE